MTARDINPFPYGTKPSWGSAGQLDCVLQDRQQLRVERPAGGRPVTTLDKDHHCSYNPAAVALPVPLRQ